MGTSYNPQIVTNGLVLALDAGNTKSYAGSGTAWNDMSGAGNNGTLTNSPTYSSANGGFITFNGTTSTTQIPSFNISGSAISIFSWFKLTSLQTLERSIVRKDGIWQLGFADPSINSVRCLLATSGTTGFTTANDFTYAFSTGTWYNFGFVYDNGVTKFYVNGVNIRTITTITGNITSGSSAVSIGGNATGNATLTYLDGSVSSTNIYNIGLLPDNVLQNFNATRGRYGI
jgi:hypothetical protein